jgi:predicted membrane-bound mannosyltransferase
MVHFNFTFWHLHNFLFGDNDFASRVPAALFSVAAIIFVIFAFKRYLGRIGALIGGVLFLISPFLLFYGRYTRNEGFIELFAVMTLYGLLRYFEKRDHFSLYLIAVVTALQFVTKEVAFIYTAQFLLFCGILLVVYSMENSAIGKKMQKVASAFSTALFFIIGVMYFTLNNQSET